MVFSLVMHCYLVPTTDQCEHITYCYNFTYTVVSCCTYLYQVSVTFSVEMVTFLALTSPSQGGQAICRGEGNRETEIIMEYCSEFQMVCFNRVTKETDFIPHLELITVCHYVTRLHPPASW